MARDDAPPEATAVELDDVTRQSLELRLARFGPEIRDSLAVVYGDRAEETWDRIVAQLTRAIGERSPELRKLDEARLLSPGWLQHSEMIGYVTYVDRFADDLRGMHDHLDHLEMLGVRTLHLMPLLMPRPGESDGGYAVADYRRVRPDLGTMADLSELATQLRSRRISLELDLVLNHVAAEHEWATRARAGEQHYRDYFYIYPDREMPDQWEASLPEVFPDFAPGNFTWDDQVNGWVWTTFNSFQWDVNWTNPDVLLEYLDIVTYLANAGVEIIRLDAIAFIFKRLGTNCQNQPEVHHLTRILRHALRVAAPAVAFKAEAIVGPSDLINYLGTGQHFGKVSDLAYHNSYMVQLWSALASRNTRLLEVALGKFPLKPSTTTWASYVRCHDDIGWAVTDEDARDAGLDGVRHRAFLSDFYAGLHPGTFARGLVFQYNPQTGDRRISGSLASLAGLEQAIDDGDQAAIETAISRIRLMHAAMLGFSGLPLLYMGDEIGLLNDYSFSDDPDHAADNRWVHRPKMPWDQVRAAIDDPASPPGRILADLRHLIKVRKQLPHLNASVESRPFPSPDRRVLLLLRQHPLGNLMEVYNFSEYIVPLATERIRDLVGRTPVDAITGDQWSLDPITVPLQPYQHLWFITN